MTATDHDHDGHTTDSKLLTKMKHKLKEVNAVVWSIFFTYNMLYMLIIKHLDSIL